MNLPLSRAVGSALGSAVGEMQPLAGGDVSEAWAVDLDDGRRVVVKTGSTLPAGSVTCEARGLEWLGGATALRVPEVLFCAEGTEECAPFLVLEWIEPGRRGADFDAGLGRGLAELHACGAPSFGFESDGFIGPLPQSNATRDSWPAFYRDCRLEPLVRRARDAGLLASDLGRRFEALFARLDELAGPAEPPARLHGDLWSGNVLCDTRGRGCLIDPAAYGGHREVDLAMLRLFGGPGEEAFDAYHEAFPLAPDWRARVPLYQLYPLLVHVLLFGRSYVARLAEALRRSGV